MRIVVISDTHGNFLNFELAIDQQPKADLFIFLGDCIGDLETIQEIYKHKQFLFVSGNCDFGSSIPSEGETVVSSKRIFYTHGHDYHVKYTYEEAINEARRREADILLFGHTHVPLTLYDNGLYIMNPGSLGHPREGNATYGYIDITSAGIVTNVVEVRN